MEMNCDVSDVQIDFLLSNEHLSKLDISSDDEEFPLEGYLEKNEDDTFNINLEGRVSKETASSILKVILNRFNNRKEWCKEK